MDETEWFLGLIAYLLAAITMELSSGGFLLYDLSIFAIMIGVPVYLIGWPIWCELT